MRKGSSILLQCAVLGLCVALLAMWPGGALDKADHAAYAVCHRIGARSFTIAGRPLPLCARCSGTYLGALAGFIVLAARRRGRAGALPARPFAIVCGLGIAAWAVDGGNSYLTLFPGLPHLYEPHNLLRLVTGTLEGLVIGLYLLPVLNLTLWDDDSRLARDAGDADSPGAGGEIPVVSGWADMAWLGLGGLAVVVLVSSELDLLLYPLALLSGLMVIGLVAATNMALVLAVLRRTGQARGWRQLLTPVLSGLLLALLELSAVGLFRAALTERFGLPF